MRWKGQQLGADAALIGAAELVRTIRTPEFDGIAFHEVLAKSALNRVPGSALPFDWTINPYRGCTHACLFCLSPETLVLGGDGRQRPIRDLRVGDVVYGTRREGADRRYVRTEVLATWTSRMRAYRVRLADGTELVASGDHRFLSEAGWKHVKATEPDDPHPSLEISDPLCGPGDAAAGPVGAELDGGAVGAPPGLTVVEIEELGVEEDLVDITTGTGDFIANGVVSHNCFARRTHEYLDFDAGKDFDTQIVVKVNVGDVLERELAKPSWRRERVALGTNTDPYQRAEGRYRLMPRIIPALAASGTPFSILTKGTLLRRDLPLLQDAAERVPVEVAMTIDVFDPELQAVLEPGAPSTAARLATVRALADAGIECTVFVMPILPYLTDSREHLDRAFGEIAAAGAAGVAWSALHLKPGAREWFLGWLQRDRPDLVARYARLYANGRVYAPDGYRKWLAGRVRPLLRAHGLDRPRRSAPRPAELAPATAVALQPTLF